MGQLLGFCKDIKITWVRKLQKKRTKAGHSLLVKTWHHKEQTKVFKICLRKCVKNVSQISLTINDFYVKIANEQSVKI